MASGIRNVECEAHGEKRAAYGCAHLLETLHDRQPRGFIWSRDEDGHINAYCEACSDELDRQGGDWNEAAEAFADIKLLCEACAVEAGNINGVSVRAQ